MTSVPNPKDFRARREHLAISERQMAAVLGIGLGILLHAENGMADDHVNRFYAAWLTRLEGMPEYERRRELARAHGHLSSHRPGRRRYSEADPGLRR